MPGADTDLIIPPALAAEIHAAADDEHRPVADIIREAFEFHQEARRWRVDGEHEADRARALGLPDDLASLTDGYRETIRENIVQGLESARRGRLVDGDTVFARIQGDLDELDRQGHK